MVSFVPYGVVTAFFFAVPYLVEKYLLSSKIPDFLAYLIVRGVVYAAVYPLLTWVRYPLPVLTFPLLMLSVVSGFCEAFALIFLYYGLSVGDASSMSSIMSGTILFYVPLSFLFLNEFYGLHILFFMMLILAGSIMVSYDKNLRPRELISIQNRQFVAGMLSLLCLAFASISSKPVLQVVNAENFTVIQHLLGFVWLVLFLPFIIRWRGGINLHFNKREVIPYMILVSLSTYIGFVALFTGFTESVSITGATTSFQGVFTFMFIFIAQKINPSIVSETQPRQIYIVRIFGSALIVVGVMLVYLI